MIQLGDALLKLRVDSTDLEKGLKNVEKRCTDLGKKMLLLGTAIAGGLIGATIASAKLGDEIYEMSKRTGLGTVALSELRYMAELSGTSIEGLEIGIKRMQMVLSDAFSGAPEATKAINELGLSIEELKAMSPEEQFYALGLAIAQIEDPTIRAATATQIFGRSGTDLLPMLANGADGIAKMREEAHEYGRIVDEEAAKKSDAFNDALVKLKESFGKIADAIGSTLMPILTDLMEQKIVPLITKVADWIKTHEDLVVSLLKIGGILAVGGMILIGLGNLAKAIIAINVAIAIMHGLAGPAGWAKLAIGIGIAAAAIVGMGKLMGSVTYETPEAEVPGMQYGGIVPGPIGAPIPILAHGGEEYLGVQNIGRPMGEIHQHFHVGTLIADEIGLREFMRRIKQLSGEDGRRNAFAPVNQGYFYGKSAI
jgi:hypothetical protein